MQLSDDPCTRLHELRQLTSADRDNWISTLLSECPRPDWPYGMWTSAYPYVVCLGPSPGNSVSGRESRGDTTDWCSPEYRPTFGSPRFGPTYRGYNDYWQKVTELCIALVKRDWVEVTDSDALALSGQLNLGTGQHGAATRETPQPPIVNWVHTLISRYFRPKVLACLGLTNLVRDPELRCAWNRVKGLQIDWSQPHYTRSFDGGYRFRLWDIRREAGNRMAIIMWPNHPGRPPVKARWSESISIASDFLREHGF